jgi:hypothetical protein
LIDLKSINKNEIAKLLLKANCPIDEVDIHNSTCLHEAVKANDNGFKISAF